MNPESSNYTIRSINKHLIRLLITLIVMITATAGAAFATPPEDAKIWRAQIRIQTADVEDAGTDDCVRVQLNSNNSTWLDYGRDDFPRNNTFTYDLKLDGVQQISDLAFLNISKTDSDGLALKSFALLINGQEIYTDVFPNSGHWLDNEYGHSTIYLVPGHIMRMDNSWLSYTQPFPPLVIPRAELESRVEGMVGDFITGNLLYWGEKSGRAYVEVAKKTNAFNTLHVDIDLAAGVPAFDPEVDVDFDVEVRCVSDPITNESRLALNIKNVSVLVDTKWYAEVLTLGIYQFIDSYINDKLSQALKNFNINQNVGVPFCPVIEVDADGDINFSLPGPGPVVTPVNQDPATKFDFKPAIVDRRSLLTLAGGAANEIRTDAETWYALLVKSNHGDAAVLNIQVDLPAQVVLADTLIEAEDEEGKRVFGPQIVPEKGGGARVSFTDRFAAGAEILYRLKVRFTSAAREDLEINSEVSMEGGSEAIRSTAFFHLENGVFMARGVFQASKTSPATPVEVPESKPVVR